MTVLKMLYYTAKKRHFQRNAILKTLLYTRFFVVIMANNGVIVMHLLLYTRKR